VPQWEELQHLPMCLNERSSSTYLCASMRGAPAPTYVPQWEELLHLPMCLNERSSCTYLCASMRGAPAPTYAPQWEELQHLPMCLNERSSCTYLCASMRGAPAPTRRISTLYWSLSSKIINETRIPVPVGSFRCLVEWKGQYHMSTEFEPKILIAWRKDRTQGAS
jgi:hypothetical protein